MEAAAKPTGEPEGARAGHTGEDLVGRARRVLHRRELHRRGYRREGRKMRRRGRLLDQLRVLRRRQQRVLLLMRRRRRWQRARARKRLRWQGERPVHGRTAHRRSAGARALHLLPLRAQRHCFTDRAEPRRRLQGSLARGGVGHAHRSFRWAVPRAPWAARGGRGRCTRACGSVGSRCRGRRRR